MKKVIEEAGETLMASKDGGGEHLVYEVADLWFHTMVLLAHHGLRAEDVVNELARRQGLSGLVEKSFSQRILNLYYNPVFDLFQNPSFGVKRFPFLVENSLHPFSDGHWSHYG